MSLVTVLGSMGTGGRVPGKANDFKDFTLATARRFYSPQGVLCSRKVYGFGGLPPSLKEKKLKEARLQNALAKAASQSANTHSSSSTNTTTTTITSTTTASHTTTHPDNKKKEESK